MEDKTFSDPFMAFILENREKCPDLLMPRFTDNGQRYINFDRLDFKVFLNFLFPEMSLHTTSFNAGSIQEDLKNAHPEYTQNNTDYFFYTWGELMTVPLISMKYYQDEIDLRGRDPKNGGLEEPVWVVQYNEGPVLFNGYHRTAIKLLQHQENIQAYVVKV